MKAAYDDGRDKGAHCGILKVSQRRCELGSSRCLHHNGHNDVYPYVEIETSGARWGSFFGFLRPTFNFFQFLLAIDFGAMLAH